VFVRRKLTLGALCLMYIHYHALVQMGSVKLNPALNRLHLSYAKHVNSERKCRGFVFEKHHGTDIVLDFYLPQVVPSIHNNPVKTGRVESPQDYDFSTDGFYRNTECELDVVECWVAERVLRTQ